MGPPAPSTGHPMRCCKDRVLESGLPGRGPSVAPHALTLEPSGPGRRIAKQVDLEGMPHSGGQGHSSSPKNTSAGRENGAGELFRIASKALLKIRVEIATEIAMIRIAAISNR